MFCIFLEDAKSLASSGLSVAALSHGSVPFARLSHTSDLFGQPTSGLAWLHNLTPNATATAVALLLLPGILLLLVKAAKQYDAEELCLLGVGVWNQYSL